MSKLSLFGAPARLYKLLESGNGTKIYEEKRRSVTVKGTARIIMSSATVMVHSQVP